jgi:mono/diheme cytochrome c family protein
VLSAAVGASRVHALGVMKSTPLLVCALALSAVAPACFLYDSSSSSSSSARWDSPSPAFTEAKPPPQKEGRPDFGVPVSQAEAPPPISGGTLLATKDGGLVVADPDRDVITLVSPSREVRARVRLRAHDEPGRGAADDAGRVHVVLRGAGELVTVDLAAGAVLARRAVCAAPRGVTFSPKDSALLVACQGGELVSVPADPASTEAPVVVRVAPDLRDVVVVGGRVFVTRYRTAEVLELDARREIVRTPRAPSALSGRRPSLAWRMIAPTGASHPEPIVVHQSAFVGSVPDRPGGYGAGPGDEGCPVNPVVQSEVSRYGAASLRLPATAVLPVDVAYDGASLYVVAAGNGHTRGRARVLRVAVAELDDAKPKDPCAPTESVLDEGEAVAVASPVPGHVVVQLREPDALYFFPERVTLELGGATRRDTGHAVFHADSGAGIACASCHGEGGDDALVWTVGTVARRTPSMLGTLRGTAPFHLSGDIPDMEELLSHVYTSRMAGPALTSAHARVVDGWLSALRAPRVEAGPDAAAVERGRVLFEGARAKCGECHAGPMRTKSGMFDVGTGGAFQVPSLVGVSARLPVMHTGCAATLAEALDPQCAGYAHVPGDLSRAELGDLAVYLGGL